MTTYFTLCQYVLPFARPPTKLGLLTKLSLIARSEFRLAAFPSDGARGLVGQRMCVAARTCSLRPTNLRVKGQATLAFH